MGLRKWVSYPVSRGMWVKRKARSDNRHHGLIHRLSHGIAAQIADEPARAHAKKKPFTGRSCRAQEDAQVTRTAVQNIIFQGLAKAGDGTRKYTPRKIGICSGALLLRRGCMLYGRKFVHA